MKTLITLVTTISITFTTSIGLIGQIPMNLLDSTQNAVSESADLVTSATLSEIHINHPIEKPLTYSDLSLEHGDLIFVQNGQDKAFYDYFNYQVISDLNYSLVTYSASKDLWQKKTITLGDRIAPVITLRFTKTRYFAGEIIDYVQESTVSDNYDQSVVLEVDSPAFPVTGANTIVYTARDRSGNTSQQEAVFTILDKPVEQVSVPVSRPDSQPKQAAVSAAPSVSVQSYQANRLYFPSLNKSVGYRNGGYDSGQAIIDSEPQLASTWGGTQSYSGTDQMNTHFIGHYYSAFTKVSTLGIGDAVIVTDSSGTAFTYKVTAKYKVRRVNTPADQYYRITSKGNQERIVLQTCIDETGNILWIIEAELQS